MKKPERRLKPMKSRKTNNACVKRTSDLLKDVSRSNAHGQISVGDFVELMGDRSFALAILIFSLPNSLPIPGIPGLSTITGVPIIFIALQVVAGRHSIWLPKRIAGKHFHRQKMNKAIRKTLPAVMWLEKFLHPRLSIFCRQAADRTIGVIIVVMALILALPLPGGNFPPGLSISLMAMATLEDDGAFAVFSVLFALANLCLMYYLLAIAGGNLMDWLDGY